MPTAIESHRRHAFHYEGMLGAIFEMYRLSAIMGAGFFDLYRENVLKAWSWARAQAGERIDATKLCVKFPSDRIELLMLRVEPTELVRGLQCASVCARTLGEQKSVGRLLRDLGKVYAENDDMEASLTYYRQSEEICHQASDLEGEARVLNSKGIAYLRLHDHPRARDCCECAHRIFQEISAAEGEAEALNGLGAAHLGFAQPNEALGFCEKALAIYRTVDNYQGEALALSGLAEVRLALEQKKEAAELYAEALVIFRQLGDRPGETHVLHRLSCLKELDKQDAARATRVFERFS